tara:strand:- start:801 stop:1043 length:243 start_codon:yes stop_codon:yes gene_type:complete
MSFKEQEASVQYEKLDGKDVAYIKPEVWITLTNTETGKEYQSDKEADDDVNNANTATKKEHIKRDVELRIAEIPLGSASK